MKIGYLQFAVKRGDKAANFAKVEQAMEGVAFDLLVLPELFATGAMFRNLDEAYALSETIPDGETTRRMVRWAECRQAHIVGGLLEYQNGFLYGAALVVGPSGELHRYRKIHPSLTESHYTPGREPLCFELNGVRFGMALCNDAVMEETHRRYRQEGVDLILHPANFCGEDIPRAVERWVAIHETPVLTVNRLGKDFPNSFGIGYAGGSRLLGRGGGVAVESGAREELRVFDFD